MDLSDLRVFAQVAREPALTVAARTLHLTPSAISKSLRRLEDSLGTPLFDRSGKQLVLNDAGRRLCERARELLALAEQARADIMGVDAPVECRVGGPAVLLWRQARTLAARLEAYAGASLRLEAMFEGEALAALARGDINLALVTAVAVEGRSAHWQADWAVADLGELTLHLVAASTHALARRRSVTAAEVLEHDFASPTRSLFCGMQRGSRSDGWRDDLFPRRIRYWSDDLHLLLGFVQRGAALAYLPGFALDEPGLVRLKVRDCPFSCSERVQLVWNRRTAPAWLDALAGA